MNKLVHGSSLAAMAFSVTIGFMGHLVSAGSVYQDLEGPVFGTRVGIYHLGSMDEKIHIQKAAATPCPKDKYKLILYKLPCGALEHSQTDDHASDETYHMVSTLSKKEKTAISQSEHFTSIDSNIFVLPLSDIPEDSLPEDLASQNFPDSVIPESSLPTASARRRSGDEEIVDVHLLPGERIENDNDAAPLSADEEELDA